VAIPLVLIGTALLSVLFFYRSSRTAIADSAQAAREADESDD
jgi:hypothetical protein